MLIIYGALRLGGIETFFVRMARERKKQGLTTKILLLDKPGTSNNELLDEMKCYAEVLYKKDIFKKTSIIPDKFVLLSKLDINKLSSVMDGINHIHIFDGHHALLANRFNDIIGSKAIISVGFYHYMKFAWGGNKVKYYEKVHRDFVFNYLPNESLMFFSTGIKDFYASKFNNDFPSSNTFRMGVVDGNCCLSKDIDVIDDGLLKICSVGRLVAFKSYNLLMLDVVDSLLKDGINVQYDIYGDGPLEGKIKEKIQRLNLTGKVKLKGSIDYSSFNSKVASYDLFIGSGTAIIQASSLGVPSIVGVENMVEAKSYGYFSDINHLEFNLKGLDSPMYHLLDLIKKYVNLDTEGKREVRKAHLESVNPFRNDVCSNNMDAICNVDMPSKRFTYNQFFYELTRVIDSIHIKISSRHPRFSWMSGKVEL